MKITLYGTQFWLNLINKFRKWTQLQFEFLFTKNINFLRTLNSSMTSFDKQYCIIQPYTHSWTGDVKKKFLLVSFLYYFFFSSLFFSFEGKNEIQVKTFIQIEKLHSFNIFTSQFIDIHCYQRILYPYRNDNWSMQPLNLYQNSRIKDVINLFTIF